MCTKNLFFQQSAPVNRWEEAGPNLVLTGRLNATQSLLLERPRTVSSLVSSHKLPQ